MSINLKGQFITEVLINGNVEKFIKELHDLEVELIQSSSSSSDIKRIRAIKATIQAHSSKQGKIRALRRLFANIYVSTYSFASIEVEESGIVQYLYVGGWDKKVRKIHPDKTLEWTVTGHTTRVDAVTVDKEGNIYAGMDYRVKKFNEEGDLLWSSASIGYHIRSCSLDRHNNVYCNSYNTLYKLNQEGELVWERAPTPYIRFLVSNAGVGYLYAGFRTTAGSGTSYDHRKYSLDGEEVHRYTSGRRSHQAGAVLADKDEGAYFGAYGRVYKRYSSSDWQTGFTSGQRFVSLAQDAEGDIFAGNEAGELFKISKSGSVLWNKKVIDNHIKDIAVDNDGFIYISDRDKKIRKLDNTGEEIWLFEDSITFSDIAVRPV